jgi:nucleoside-diphosphate-sugar epimerase
MNHRPRVLVTGSSGRVGSAIARRLALDYQVTGIDLVPGESTTFLGSIEDASLLARALRGAEAVVHTAALHAPHVGHVTAARFHAVNVEATRRLLDLALANGVRRLVYTSSTSVYGHALVPQGAARWVTEDLTPLPRDVYDETKLAAEALVRAAATDGGMTCTILRMSRSFPEAEHLVTTYRLYRGVDLRDVAEAHALALERDQAGCETFNVSARSPFRPEDCRSLLQDPWSTVNRYFPEADRVYRDLGWPPPRSIDRVYVTAKAETGLGYSPRFNFADLLATLRRPKSHG